MTQTDLNNFVVSEQEASEIDDLKNKYFSAKSNTTVKLTFSDIPADDEDSPDKKCVTGRLIKQMVPVFAGGKKTGEMEEALLRQMVISSLNGKPCNKVWRIKSKKMRELFKTYADNNLLTKRLFILEIKGELKECNYILTALDKPGN